MYQAKALAKKIAYNLDFHKGEQVVLRDVKDKTPLASYYIFCSADNARKLKGLTQAVEDIVDKSEAVINHIEGKNDSMWVIIDINDIVVHILTSEMRYKYRLDDIYGKCPEVDFTPKAKKVVAE